MHREDFSPILGIKKSFSFQTKLFDLVAISYLVSFQPEVLAHEQDKDIKFSLCFIFLCF